MTLLWRKVLECSSSLLTSWSLCPHSLRHPCVLTPITCLLTHLIVIPDFSLESSHPSHPWLLTLTSLVLPLIPYSVFSHTPTLIALTKSSHRHPWLLTPITCATTHSHECSHTECSHTHRHPWLLTPITCATMLTHPRVLSHTHHLTSSVTTRTLTSFSLVSPHWVISHHLCSERVSVPTSMVSYYHQVITHCSERTCAPTHSHLPCPHTLCSPHFISPPSLYKCITNASPMHHQPSPTLSHPSCLHHIIITSSPLPITYHHQSLPLTPYNTPNPPNRLLNPLQSQFIPITTIVAPHRLPNNIKPIQSRRWDKPQGLAGQSQLIPSQYPLHTKSSTKDCTDNTISFNTIQIVFLYPKRIKYSYVKYILSL